MEKNSISKEMLSLVDKVENWKMHTTHQVRGSIGDIRISIEVLSDIFPIYYILMDRKNTTFYECNSPWFTRNGKMIRQEYKNARKKIVENEQKVKEETLNYVGSLLK